MSRPHQSTLHYINCNVVVVVVFTKVFLCALSFFGLAQSITGSVQGTLVQHYTSFQQNHFSHSYSLFLFLWVRSQKISNNFSHKSLVHSSNLFCFRFLFFLRKLVEYVHRIKSNISMPIAQSSHIYAKGLKQDNSHGP